MLRLAALLATVASLFVVGPFARSAAPLRGTLVHGTFESRALAGPIGFAVYLPPGYRAGARYPVIYFLHGLPATPDAYRLRAPLVATWLEAAGVAAIAVVPQAARTGDSDPAYLDWGRGRDWERALALELPAYIDHHFKTIAAARGRALVGISAGGYGAMLLGLDHPSEFALVESWSGYFEPTDPDGTRLLDLGSDAANAQADLHERIPGLKATSGTPAPLLAFYSGDHDWRFEPDNARFDAELSAAAIQHRFALYPGGHALPLWSAHAGDWLRFAAANLLPAQLASVSCEPDSRVRPHTLC